MRTFLILAFAAALNAQTYKLTIVPAEGKTGQVAFRELVANGKNEIRLKAPDLLDDDVEYTLPAVDGSANFSLVTDGAGILSFKEMVSAFDTGITVQQVQSRKHFLEGINSYDLTIRPTLTTAAIAMYPTGWNSGRIDMITPAGDVNVMLDSDESNAGYAQLTMLNPTTAVETVRIRGGSSSVAGSVSLSATNGDLGFFASGVGQASIYAAGGVEKIRLSQSQGIRLYDGAGSVQSQFTPGFIRLWRQATPGASATSTNDLYFRTDGSLCSVDSTGTETCYGSSASIPNPLEVGGAGCGEIRLKEDSSTGGRYYTWKTCDTAGLLESTFFDAVGNKRFNWDDTTTTLYGTVAFRGMGGTTNAAAFTYFGGNGRFYVRNNSGYAAVDLSAQSFGHGTLNLVDVNGAGEAYLGTGETNGARLTLNAADTSRLGLEAAGGTFTSGGFLKTYDLSGATVNRLDENGSYSSLAQTRQLRLLGDISGSVSFRAPTLVTSYTKWWPSSAGSVGDCLKLDGTDVTALVWGACLSSGYVDTTTNQSIAGNKYTSGAWRGTELAVRATSSGANVWQAYLSGGAGVEEVWPSGSSSFATGQFLGNYSSTGVAALLLLDPASGSERVRIQGGSSGTNPVVAIDRSPGAQSRLGADGTRGGYLDLYDTTPTLRARLNVSTSVAFQANNSSGSSRVVIDGSGTGGRITSAGDEFVIEETGDSLGTMRFRLRNRTGGNGFLVENAAVDVVDQMMTGSSGTMRTMRLENRTGFGFTYLESSPEFQFGDLVTSYPAGIGLLANSNGAGVNKGKYFRFLGSSSGYAALKAPASVTSYTLDLPSATGTAGQCLYLVTTSTLGWTTCGGGGSYVDTTTNQNISGTKYTSNAWRGIELGVRSTSTNGNVFQAYISGTAGIAELWPSGTSSFPSTQWTANYSSSGYGALTFNNSSTGAELIKIGGSAGNAITLYQSSGTGAFLGGNGSGGQLSIYDSTGQEVFRIAGASNRVWTGSTLATGYTGSLSLGTCTIDVFRGIITGATGSC